MYIAMNRFKIVKGKESEFENVWKNRETHLAEVPGFKNFNLVKATCNNPQSALNLDFLTEPLFFHQMKTYMT